MEKEEKNESEAKNPLNPDYTPCEQKQRDRLITAILRVHRIEESPHEEYDGMTRSQYHMDNERRVNTYLAPRKNKEDTIIATGTTRQKLFAFVSAINNLNLTADITAFNEDDTIIANLGEAMEALIRKSEELDLDEEKDFLRLIELFKQGEVFVEDVAIKRNKLKKKLSVAFDGKIPKGEEKLWTERIVKTHPSLERNILSPVNVYLGDITQFDIQKQPHIFTRAIISYDDAKTVYGDWERWQFVSNVRKDFVFGTSQADWNGGNYDKNFALEDIKNGQVEVLKYQALFENEYQIMLNGVMMLPVGFPLPWNLDMYNMEHQILEPFSPFFAHGKSLPAKFKTLDSVLDDFLRIMVLKNHRSLVPAIANLTGRVLSARNFMPGKITNGVDPSQVKLMLPEATGVTAPEFSMFEKVQELVDNNSINPQFQGQQSNSSGTTATEVLNRQRQAEVMLGISIFAASLLKKKLSYLRIANIIVNWFSPIDQKVDEIKKGLVNVYKNITVQGEVPRRGTGENMVNFVDKTTAPMPNADEIMQQEIDAEKTLGVPVKKYYLNAEAIQNAYEAAKLSWRVVIVSKPKHTSELEQIMFRNMLVDLGLFQQDWNIPELEAEAARVWNKNPAKIFKPKTPDSMASGLSMPGQGQNGQPAPSVGDILAKKTGDMSAAGGMGSLKSAQDLGMSGR